MSPQTEQNNNDTDEQEKEKRKIEVECSKCGYSWTFEGVSKRPTCPSCFHANTLENNE